MPGRPRTTSQPFTRSGTLDSDGKIRTYVRCASTASPSPSTTWIARGWFSRANTERSSCRTAWISSLGLESGGRRLAGAFRWIHGSCRQDNSPYSSIGLRQTHVGALRSPLESRTASRSLCTHRLRLSPFCRAPAGFRAMSRSEELVTVQSSGPVARIPACCSESCGHGPRGGRGDL